MVHVARTGKMRNVYKILVGIDHLVDIGVSGWIVSSGS
jgi:hypothetical protein